MRLRFSYPFFQLTFIRTYLTEYNLAKDGDDVSNVQATGYVHNDNLLNIYYYELVWQYILFSFRYTKIIFTVFETNIFFCNHQVYHPKIICLELCLLEWKPGSWTHRTLRRSSWKRFRSWTWRSTSFGSCGASCRGTSRQSPSATWSVMQSLGGHAI